MAVNPRTGYMYVPNRSYEYRIELKRITMLTVEEEFLGQFSTGGEGDGDIFGPRSIAIDKEDNVYVTDELLQRVSIWDHDGEFLGKWGTAGSGDGEFNKPAGIAFNSEDNLFLVGRGQPPDPEVHQGRQVPVQVGQLRRRRRPIQLSLGNRH